MEVQRLLGSCRRCPRRYRQVVHLRYVEELEPTQIARLLQQPAGTIRRRLHEALSASGTEWTVGWVAGAPGSWRLRQSPAGRRIPPRLQR